MELLDWVFGKDPEMQKLGTGTKSQQKFGGSTLFKLLESMLKPGGGYQQTQQYHQGILGGGPGDQGAYDKFSAPYLQQFQEHMLPQIAERFAGQGALSSSAFGQALGGASSGLQSNLAQLFSQLQQQSASQQYGQFNQMSQTGLGYSPFQYHETGGSQGALIPILTGLANAYAGGGFK
jgi:hypothetical protein